jgi:hypothetical protein
MMDRLEDLPPQEPYLRLARQGREVWNKWKLGELETQEEKALAARLVMAELPDKTKPVNFSGVNFTSNENNGI